MTISVFVIALQDSTRFPFLESDLKRERLVFTKVNAVNGKLLGEDEISKLVNLGICKSRLGYAISRPLIGCALSHRKVYELSLRQSSEWTLIFEEDVRLKHGFAHSLLKLNLENLDKHPVVIQLFTRGERFISRKEQRKLENGSTIFEFSTIPGQAAAYLINRRAVELALKSVKIDGPSDWPNWASSVKFFGVFPFLVSESGEGTTIGSKSVSKFRYRLRVIAVLTGIHLITNRWRYDSTSSYWKLIAKPLAARILWQIKGRKTYPRDEKTGLWVLR